MTPLYRAFQLPYHHASTRLFLLRLRGPLPPPGIPATPVRRLAAGALDLALCATLAGLGARSWPRRLAWLAPLAIAYHAGCWLAGGRTPGARALGLRVLSVDGSRLRPAQAAVRLVALAPALRRLRAVHDALAGTEVVQER